MTELVLLMLHHIYIYPKFRTNVSYIIFYLSTMPKVKTSLNAKMFHSNGSGGRGQVSAKKEGEIFSPKGKEIWKARPTGEGKSDSAGNQIVWNFCINGQGHEHGWQNSLFCQDQYDYLVRVMERWREPWENEEEKEIFVSNVMQQVKALRIQMILVLLHLLLL